MIWTTAGKIFDIYDDAALSVLHDDPTAIQKLGSEYIVDATDVRRLSDAQFAVILEDSQGKLHRKYPLTPETIKLSAAYLEKTGSRLLPLMRHVASYHLNKIASAMGLPVGERIQHWAKQATRTPEAVLSNVVPWKASSRYQAEHVDIPAAQAEIRSSTKTASAERGLPEKTGRGARVALFARMAAVQDDGLRADLAKLASKLHEEKPEDVVNLFRTIDQKYGLSKHYSRIMSPEDAVHSKLASALPEGDKLAKIIKLAGDVPRLMSLGLNPGTIQEMRTSPAEVYNYLPDEIRDKIEREILPTL